MTGTDSDRRSDARRLRIAVLRCERLPRFVTWEIHSDESLFDDYHRLLDAFAELGVDAESVAWSGADVDWNVYDAVVIRSTWDYVDHLPRFLEVITAIERSSATLLNPAEAVRWNADKRYLGELAAAGVPVVPTRYLAPGDGADGLPVDHEYVVKPTSGAGARFAAWP